MEDKLLLLKLSKAGYGSMLEIEEWDAERVLTALAYEKFLSDYEGQAVADIEDRRE